MSRLGQFYRTTIFVLFHIGVVLLLFHLAPNLFRSDLFLIKTPFSVTLPHISTLTSPSASIMSSPSSQSANATSWIQSRLTPLFAAARPRPADAGASDAAAVDDASFQDAFTQTFSPACEVRHNHVVEPLQALKEALVARRAATTHASAVWDEELVSTNDDKADEPTVVAGALVATYSLPFRIRVTAAQRRMHMHFSAKIERDESVPGDDNRRITSFYYTSVDKTPPIHFAVPRAAQKDRSDGQ